MTLTADRPNTRPAGAGLMFDNPRPSSDSSLTFWTMAQTVALDCATVVDVGCGRGAMVGAWGDSRSPHDLRAPGRTVIGIDVDPDAADNPVVDRFGRAVASAAAVTETFMPQSAHLVMIVSARKR